MKIITVSRQFGSGGRELGRRLAEELGIPCYDHQVIEMIAERISLDSTYVSNVIERDPRSFYSYTAARGFSRPAYTLVETAQMIGAEQELIKLIASQGDCVIIGRAADILLSDMKPFRIFVCASDEARVRRCFENAREGERLTEKGILRRCRELDRRRLAYRRLFTDERWGDASCFDLCINTSGRTVKDIIPGLVAYIENCFLGESDNGEET